MKERGVILLGFMIIFGFFSAAAVWILFDNVLFRYLFAGRYIGREAWLAWQDQLRSRKPFSWDGRAA